MHAFDQLTGEAASRYFRTWALAPTAAEADALSTAWMNLDLGEIEAICRERSDLAAIVLPKRGGALVCFGHTSPEG